jgi:hypothetical protein
MDGLAQVAGDQPPIEVSFSGSTKTAFGFKAIQAPSTNENASTCKTGCWSEVPEVTALSTLLDKMKLR